MTLKSAICDHIEIWQNRKSNYTKVLCICDSEYATKIQEALLIKTQSAIHNPIDNFP